MSQLDELDPRETNLHPRHQYDLIGHEKAERELLKAYTSNKFHHAWLLCGPPGIGKATLAYRLARFVLANSQAGLIKDDEHLNLFVDPNNPTSKRIAARGHTDLFVLQRELNPQTKKLRPAISVDDARKVSGFFQKTAGEGGWRVCVIDAADDLNSAAGNAILKILEEPPAKCLFIIVSHAPGRLLATIRSRCLRLDLCGLTNEDVSKVLAKTDITKQLATAENQSLIELSKGSPGKFIQLVSSPGAQQFIRFMQMAQKSTQLDYSKLISIAAEFQKRGAEIEFNIFADLLGVWIANRATSAAQQQLAQSANAFASFHSKFSNSIARTNALNLDRRQTLMMAFDEIEKIISPENSHH